MGGKNDHRVIQRGLARVGFGSTLKYSPRASPNVIRMLCVPFFDTSEALPPCTVGCRRPAYPGPVVSRLVWLRERLDEDGFRLSAGSRSEMNCRVGDPIVKWEMQVPSAKKR